MFDDANGGQIGWLLPFAIGGGLLAAWSWRREPSKRAIAVLFLGWIALYGGVFSYAQGIFHSYYTSALAPGVAALAGIGSVAMIDAVRRDRRWLIAVFGIVAVTLWTQIGIAARTPDFYGWVRPITFAVRGRGTGGDGGAGGAWAIDSGRRGVVGRGTAAVAGGVGDEPDGERIVEHDAAAGGTAAGRVGRDVRIGGVRQRD